MNSDSMKSMPASPSAPGDVRWPRAIAAQQGRTQVLRRLSPMVSNRPAHKDCRK